MMYLLGLYLFTTCALWVVFYLQSVRALGAIRSLPILDPAAPNSDGAMPPTLSVIIAARNEASTLPAALETLIEQTYPGLEIILVNDRSTDNTAEVIDAFAQRDARIRCIHIKDLPPDWIGKVHALHVASQQARGDWMLFTDADVHHSARLWSSAIEYVERGELDHLAILPQVTSRGLLLNATMKTFAMLFLTTAKVEKIRDPDSPAAIGIGAFNLVRSKTFRQTAGFEWLRMEVADDYGLGVMLKSIKAKADIVTAYNDLKIKWYASLQEMARGLDKNIMAPGTQYKTIKLIVNPLVMLGVSIAPFVGVLFWPSPVAWLALLTLLVVSVAAMSIAKISNDNTIYWLLSPLGLLVISYIFTRACLLCLARDGIIWRGTHYSRKKLQQYQRVRL